MTAKNDDNDEIAQAIPLYIDGLGAKISTPCYGSAASRDHEQRRQRTAAGKAACRSWKWSGPSARSGVEGASLTPRKLRPQRGARQGHCHNGCELVALKGVGVETAWSLLRAVGDNPARAVFRAVGRGPVRDLSEPVGQEGAVRGRARRG